MWFKYGRLLEFYFVCGRVRYVDHDDYEGLNEKLYNPKKAIQYGTWVLAASGDDGVLF